MNINKHSSFGSQMKLDLPAVQSILENIFQSIKEERKGKKFTHLNLSVRKEGKLVTILQLKHLDNYQLEELKSQLPIVVYILVKNLKPNTIFIKYINE